jgi:hypothetical protein
LNTRCPLRLCPSSFKGFYTRQISRKTRHSSRAATPPQSASRSPAKSRRHLLPSAPRDLHSVQAETLHSNTHQMCVCHHMHIRYYTHATHIYSQRKHRSTACCCSSSFTADLAAVSVCALVVVHRASSSPRRRGGPSHWAVGSEAAARRSASPASPYRSTRGGARRRSLAARAYGNQPRSNPPTLALTPALTRALTRALTPTRWWRAALVRCRTRRGRCLRSLSLH